MQLACALKLTSWYFAWQHSVVFSRLELNAEMWCHSVTTAHHLQGTNEAYNFFFTKCRYYLIFITEGTFVIICVHHESCTRAIHTSLFLTPSVGLCGCIKKIEWKTDWMFQKLRSIFGVFIQNIIWTITLDVCRFSLIWCVKLQHRKLLKTAWRKKKMLQLQDAVRFSKIKE